MNFAFRPNSKLTEPGLFFSTDYMREAAKTPLLAFFVNNEIEITYLFLQVGLF